MFVSLGGSCSVAYQLQEHNQRECAFPFDWVRVDDLNMITEIINNNFEGFITSVEKITESDKFPLSYDDNFPDKTSDKTSDKKSIIMKNKYGVKFYHDFESITIEEICQINQKYQRRINRMIELIKSNNEICFVRDEIKPQKITEDKIKRFIETIKSINNECKFKFILICHNPQNNNYDILRISLKDVIIFNDKEKFGNWKRPNVCWDKIFIV